MTLPRRVWSLGAALALAYALIAAGCMSDSDSNADRRRSATQDERLAPPVIKEGFTPLPCPRSRAARGTTDGAIGCAEQKVLRTDAAINRRSKTIFGLLRDRTAKRRFVAAEDAWLAYRKATCTNAADVFRGGSAQRVTFATCMAARNVEHVKELAALERLVRQTR
jgi:uncharacterized protein YecT (DUF1311 family)